MQAIKKYFCLAFLSIFLLASPVWAACSQDGTTWTCSSFADLLALIQTGGAQDITDGDTVSLSAGSYEATEDIDFQDGKAITLQGAGYATTSISRAGQILDLNESGSRVTGIKFIASGGTAASIIVQGTGWRIDNCYFDNNTGVSQLSIRPIGTDRTTLPEGLIDHNHFDEGRVSMGGMGSFAKCCIEWAKDYIFGTENAVFIEDNYFYKTVSGGGNVIDGNRGASYVARFNTIEGETQIAAHSLQSSTERAFRNYEVYGNTLIVDPGESPWAAIWPRGGTGFVWDNTLDADYDYDIIFDNVRSNYNIGGDAGECDGNSNWDENTVGESGWLCRDQTGAGKDTSLWTVGSPYPAQEKYPVYLWLNRTDGSISSVVIKYDDDNWIQSDRDFYNEVVGFDGITGTGSGTLAARPATCTAGVAYWATDQCEWNSKSAGNDGCLYTCDVGDDAWTLYYTPSTYPHSLITGTEVSGTIIPGGCKESEVVTGGKTIVVTLQGTELVATFGDNNQITTDFIAGLDSAQAEAGGWDAKVKGAALDHTHVVRTSATVVTVTLPAVADYQITAQETITLTIPASSTEEGVIIEATPTFVVSAEQIGAESVSAVYNASGPTTTYKAGGITIAAP